MSVGLIALLDDIAAIAKVAAASLDDIAGQAAKAGSKAAGVVIDDAAVTPRYVTGFSPARELPIIGKIATGSLKNKIIFLLPAALLLSYLVPWVITPLLMIGGVYLCYEGAEKIFALVHPHAAPAHEAELPSINPDAKSLEEEKIAGAIKTDFILSAEIMAITLGSMPNSDFITQAIVLAVVGIGITGAVYGAVALIVKMDDLGLILARARTEGAFGAVTRFLGRALVQGMPYFLKVLGLVGTAAMLWVGGGIIVHGLEQLGYGAMAHFSHDAGKAVAALVPAVGGFLAWFVEALGAGVLGLVLGLLVIPLASQVLSPAWRMAGQLWKRGLH
jgi:uncharacterized protein